MSVLSIVDTLTGEFAHYSTLGEPMLYEVIWEEVEKNKNLHSDYVLADNVIGAATAWTTQQDDAAVGEITTIRKIGTVINESA